MSQQPNQGAPAYESPEPYFGYPQGPKVNQQVQRRHRTGAILYVLLMTATIVAIIALIALLYTIINDSFGLVATEFQKDPDDLVLNLQKDILLSDPDTFSSEDDTELVSGIMEDPNGIGFFGYSYYQENSADLKLLAVDDVTPSAEAVEEGNYPLSRSLFIYSAADILLENAAANAFVNYFLTHVNEEIEDVGYFPVSAEKLAQSQQQWKEINELDMPAGQWAAIDPTGIDGHIDIAGSSTVNPLTARMLERFGADGYVGTATNESIGSGGGFRAFCVDTETDISNASRPIKSGEFAACRSNQLRPFGFPVGTDALAVVVNPQNGFLANASSDELREIFTTADKWSDVNAEWPDETIKRYIPGADSGTLDFFVETVFPVSLEELPKELLVGLLVDNISAGLGRRFESEQRFFEDKLVYFAEGEWAAMCAGDAPSAGCTLGARDQDSVLQLVNERVVVPNFVAHWNLVDSILKRDEIEHEAFISYPDAELSMHSWINLNFLTSPQSSTPELAGVKTAILGSLWVVAITALFSFPVGVGAAIYLEEYAADTRLNRIIQTNINNLAGVPSIIYGLLGLAVFVRALEGFTSGTMFGVSDPTTANGRTIMSAGLTLGLLILPIIIISAQEALRAVPNSMRQAGMALGATKWQTIWAHVLPSAFPGILTGTILSISRALGETAPLVVVGASTAIFTSPQTPFDKFTTLPIQIYQWTSRPQAEFRNLAAAAIIVLLVLLLTLNATAIYLRNRFAGRAV
jgi:phosphate transport system permease protein